MAHSMPLCIGHGRRGGLIAVAEVTFYAHAEVNG